MPIVMELAREGRVILQTYSEPMQVQEMVDNLPRIHAILSKSNRPVHTITDARAVTRLPRGFLASGKKFFRETHPMAGLNVLVTNNDFFKTVTDVFVRLVPHYKIRVCKTMEAAWSEVDKLLAEEELLERKTS